MASGYGISGGQSRCFTFWQEFQKCYAMADVPSECIPQKDDYLECLHHTKEIARLKELREHYVINHLKQLKADREKGELKATGGVMRLGLIQTDSGDSGSGDSGGDSSSGSEGAKGGKEKDKSGSGSGSDK